jgi:predicted phage terminase large subunit-like protein
VPSTNRKTCSECGQEKAEHTRHDSKRCILCQIKVDQEAHKAALAKRAAEKRAKKRKHVHRRQIRSDKKAKAKKAKEKVPPTPEELEAKRKAAGEKISQSHAERMQREAAKELARRELARRDLLEFIKYFEPTYDAGWVHIEICRELEQFTQDIIDGKSPHLMLFMPPRHGKSLIASTYFPAWFLGRFPEKEMIGSSYASSLANQFSRRVQDLLKDPGYQAIFPGVGIAKDHSAIEEWATAVNGRKTRRGGYRAAGVGGPITGKGADCFIIDDPVKNREEAESPADRESKKAWYTSTAYTRLMPGSGMLIIMTRWHDDDLAGWQIERMREGYKDLEQYGALPEGHVEWKIISYPAVATQDEEHRKKGEALHETRYPLARLKQIKHVLGPRDWSALYQQTPTAEEGDYFKKTMIRYFHESPPDPIDIYCAGDLSISKADSADYSVFVVAGLDRQDNLYILDELRGRWDTDEIVQQMMQIQRLWQPRAFGVESGAIYHAVRPYLDKRIKEERLYSLVVEELPIKGRDKMLRARPIQGRMAQGKVLFPDNALWVPEFINELLRFPNGVKDDRVDAVAWIGQMLLDRSFVGRPGDKKAAKSWKERLKDYVASAGPKKRTHMAA